MLFDAKNNHYCSGPGDCITVFEQLIKIRRGLFHGSKRNCKTITYVYPKHRRESRALLGSRNTYVCDCNGIYFGAKCEKKACMSIGDDVILAK